MPRSAASPRGLSRDSGPSPDNVLPAFSPPCAPLLFGVPCPASAELSPARRPIDDFDDDEDLQFSGLTGGRLVHDALLENGVDTVFGYSGGANLPILDQFHDSKIRFVMNRSEQCCGHAAEGYARSSGRTGVILTTSGPGLTNIITPLQDARGDSTPLVALSGQVPTAAVGTDAFQECMAVDLTRPCTKWSYQVQSVEEVRSVMHEAFRVATTGKRGPVHIDLPKDIMTAVLQGAWLGLGLDPVGLDPHPHPHPSPNPHPHPHPNPNVLQGAAVPLPMQPPPQPVDRKALDHVANLLRVAKKPILYVGQGANDAVAELTALAELCNIPVLTTLP